MVAELLINNNRLIQLTESIYVIGRAQDCDIVISFPSLSRHHAWLSLVESQYILCDGDFWTGKTSVNGTRINNKILKDSQGQALKDNDEISLAPLVFLRFFCKEIKEPDIDSTLL